MRLFRSLFAAVALIGLAVGFALPAQACALCGNTSYVVVNANSWVSLRAEPFTSAARLAQVPVGAEVIGLGGEHPTAEYLWLRVFYNGHEGWMPDYYLRNNGIVGQGNTGGSGNGGYQGSGGGEYRSVINVQNWASLRAEPNRQARRLAQVPGGQRVHVNNGPFYSDGENWYNVDYQGQTGFIPAQYLSQASTNNGPTNTGPANGGGGASFQIDYNVVGVVVNVNNWASLRQSPNRNAARLAQVPRGAQVYINPYQEQLFAGGESWSNVSYNGAYGWMPDQYLSAY